MPHIERHTTRPWVNRKPGRTFGRDKRYDTHQWRKLRKHGLMMQPFCVECGAPATVRDHITPVTEGGSFWDIDNHQSMCAKCHNAKSGSEGNR
jgi:5-methylcytosine-specific restriction enzyme A